MSTDICEPQTRLRFVGDCGPLFASLAKAQAEFGEIHRDKTVKVTTKAGGSYTFNYAPLENILAATLPSLNKYEVFFTQPLAGKTLYTILAHSSGCRMEMEADLAGNGDIKEFGGEITYLRRYCGTTALGLASEEDDDGNMAAGDHREVSDRNKPQLDTAKAEAEEIKISAFIDKCGDQAKLTKLRSDIPGYALFEQQKTGLIQKIDDKLPTLATGPDPDQSAIARVEHDTAINNCKDGAKLLGSLREAIATDKRLTDADRIACTSLLTTRGAVLDGGNSKKKRTPAQLETDFFANVPLQGMNLKPLYSMREWLNSDEASGAAAQGLSAEQILKCSNYLEPFITKAEAYQAEPVNA